MIDTLLHWIGAALGAAVLGALGWVVTNFVAKPILDFRKDRMTALQVAERYAFSWMSNGTEASKQLNDASAALLAHARGGSWVFRLYCKAMRYDLEQVA